MSGTSTEVEKWCEEHILPASQVSIFPRGEPSEGWTGLMTRGAAGLSLSCQTPELVPDEIDIVIVTEDGAARISLSVLDRDSDELVCSLPYTVEVDQRRNSYRLPVILPVKVTLPSGKVIQGMTINCSTGGVSAAFKTELAYGTNVALKMVPDGDELGVKAKVRHAALESGHWVTGLQFSGLSSRQDNMLSRFIAVRQRRLLSRVQATVPVKYRLKPPSRECETVSTDISTGGVRFRSAQPLEFGTRVDLTLIIEGASYAVRGAVLRTDEVDGDSYAGVSLDPLPAPEAARFDEAVRGLILAEREREQVEERRHSAE